MDIIYFFHFTYFQEIGDQDKSKYLNNSLHSDPLIPERNFGQNYTMPPRDSQPISRYCIGIVCFFSSWLLINEDRTFNIHCLCCRILNNKEIFYVGQPQYTEMCLMYQEVTTQPATTWLIIHFPNIILQQF